MIFGAVFFGLGVVVAIISLMPGGGLLRLDADGFEVSRPFLPRKRFGWRDVSDFDLIYGKATSYVVFKAAKPQLGMLDRTNAWLARGRNEGLPDTYGLASEDLARLMTAWQNLATAGGMPTP
jgi:hypothetical protein